ncbi:sporulation sigma factor SigK [compost metagenome]
MTWDATKSMFSTYATVCIYNALGMHLRNMRTLIHTNTTFYEQRINGTQLTYADILESNEKAEDNVMIENGLSDIYRLTEECLEALTNPLHRLVVETWANSNFEKTQIILAKELDISQTYVCRILKKFRNTLKEKLEAC